MMYYTLPNVGIIIKKSRWRGFVIRALPQNNNPVLDGISYKTKILGNMELVCLAHSRNFDDMQK
jgi:hypothetical protein